jgi:hypothetical protein
VVVTPAIAQSIRTHRVQGADLLQLQREDWKDIGLTNVVQLRKLLDAIEGLEESAGWCADKQRRLSNLRSQYSLRLCCPVRGVQVVAYGE